MHAYLQKKYINLISSRLPKFKWKKNNLANFRCIICGDSKSNKNKKRGYFLEKKNSFSYYCFNCGHYEFFDNFLKTFDYQLFKEMCYEHYKDHDEIKKKYYEDNPNNDFKKPEFVTKTPLRVLKKISSLKADHPAKLYIVKRCIPNWYHHKLFYCPQFKKWVNWFVPDKFNKYSMDHDESRLIIPLLDQKLNLIGISCRTFNDNKIQTRPKEPKYYTIMIDENAPKIYNLDTLDIEAEKCYCTEGPIDAMFLPNSIAMVGADLVLRDLDLDKSKVIRIFDNEPRNKEMIVRTEKAIKEGYPVAIWPKNFKYKDINEAIMAGSTSEEVQGMIDENTYTGLSALTKLGFWRI